MAEFLRDLGLDRLPPFHRDRLFWGAVLAPLFFWGGLGLIGGARPIAPEGILSRRFFFLVFGQPLFEELLFRGLLQGEFLRFAWGVRRWDGVTAANGLASLLFTLGHFASHPPLWAASVLAPSLIFGYFRDRSSSLYPSIVLHCYYNAGYFILTGLP